MAGFARAGRYDVLHLHEYRHTRFLKALPKVMHHHNDPFGNIDMNVPSHVTQYWDQLSKNQALVAVSTFVGERLHALRDRAGAGAVPTRIMVNQSGVDATMIGDAQRQQSRAELRRELGLKDSDVMFLFAGALRSEKGVVQLARAFNKLAAEHEDAVLVLAGGKKLWVDNDPPQETAELQVHALLKDLVGARRVFLPGIVSSEAMPAYYAAADVFVLHSMFQEAFGLVILESFLAGVPVIGARSGAIPELVKDGRTGLLVDQGDVDGLCDAMRRLLLDRGLREELGAAGRQIALDMSWDKTVDRMKDIYGTVLGR
jgi:glycosyltransferase involved in cell wall biosynthesis